MVTINITGFGVSKAAAFSSALEYVARNMSLGFGHEHYIPDGNFSSSMVGLLESTGIILTKAVGYCEDGERICYYVDNFNLNKARNARWV